MTVQVGKLGRSEVWKPDRNALWLGRYLDTRMYTASPQFDDWTGAIAYKWFMNNQLGCCTITSIAHVLQQRCALIGRDCTITDADIVAAYSAATGYDPSDPDTDRGGRNRDALNVARKVGIGEFKIDVWMPINHRDLKEMRAALHCFGSIVVGGDLPKRILSQRNTWYIPSSPGEDDRPRSLGGHAWMLTGYDKQNWWSMPWVDLVTFDDEWLLTYIDEAAVFLDSLWVTQGGFAPNGLDYQRLAEDLRMLSDPLSLP